jgi:Protein of unknown function (DUF3047)
MLALRSARLSALWGEARCVCLKWFAVFAVWGLVALPGCTTLESSSREEKGQSDEAVEAGVTPNDAQAPKVTQSSDQKDGVLELFPQDLQAGAMPLGWEKWILHPLKRKTNYGWKKDRKGVYLEARSRSSASGLIKRLDIDPRELPLLQFSWMIDGLLEGADVGDRALEDSPARVVLAFDGDKATLPIKDRAFIERVKTFTGQDIPYASLVYVWDNVRPINSIVQNPHTGRIQKLVASTGGAGVRSWQTHRRDIVKDFRAAYGKEPGKLIGIAIMTDTDNTKTYAQARYRGLSLSKTEPLRPNAKSDQTSTK